MTLAVPALRIAKQALRSFLPRAYLNWRDERFYARYGEVELHILDLLCDRTRCSIDVGANEGCYTNVMRRLSRRVVAFEPIPWLAEKLTARFGADVDIRQVALSSAHGRTILHVPIVDGIDVEGCATIDDKAASHYARHREIPVATERLDEVWSDDVGFIKIDTEGHEEDVLRGAEQTIAHSRPRLLVEIVDYLAPGGADRISAFLGQLGYRGHFIYRRQLLPAKSFDPHVMQAKGNEPDLTAPLSARDRFPVFAYNFLFFPEEEPTDTLERIATRVARL